MCFVLLLWSKKRFQYPPLKLTACMHLFTFGRHSNFIKQSSPFLYAGGKYTITVRTEMHNNISVFTVWGDLTHDISSLRRFRSQKKRHVR